MNNTANEVAADVTLSGVCAVCLRTHVHGSRRLKRHGFSVVGAGRGFGHLGAWHTGPCNGASFPHLGESTKGTEWALAQVRANLARNAERQAELVAGQVELTYGYSVGSSWNKKHMTETVRPGDRERHAPGAPVYCKVPAYTDLRDDVVRQAQDEAAGLAQSVATYTEVLAAWKPAALKSSSKVVKVAVVHMEASFKGNAQRGPAVPRCRMWAGSPAWGRMTKNTATVTVTCRACCKSLAAK